MEIRDEPEPGGARLLVVDPDLTTRDQTCRLLEQHGYIVETAANFQEAASILSRAPPDLVLLEFLLPVRDEGVEMCLRLTRRHDAPAVILRSAKCKDSDRIEGLEAGADDFLRKDCNPRELLARVKAVLRRRSRQGSHRTVTGRG